ncbi:MAG: septation protein IspZ [Pseudomonadales bacterium]|nr:septation protein IspZ [Pseudomonadales bacterium]
MKQIAELVPIILFFAVYQLDGRSVELWGWHYRFDGIYSATWVLIFTTLGQVVLTRLITGHVEKRLLLLAAVVVVFGGATLALHNQLFIQWKPTIFNWALAGIFAGTSMWTGQTVMQRAMGAQLTLPVHVWQRLNLLWIANFLVVGALNLYVAYRFSESTWVSYKLYSAIGFTLLLSGLTVLLIMPHLETDQGEPPAESD